MEDPLMRSIAAHLSLFSILCLALGASACSGQASSGQAGASPTATMNAYYDALKMKDVEAVKKTLADGYVKMLESAGVPAERAFQPMMERLPAARPATRNETIVGDRATLEVRDEDKGRWETVAFVKEGGVWKIALEEPRD
jgi:hypothetical protein